MKNKELTSMIVEYTDGMKEHFRKWPTGHVSAYSTEELTGIVDSLKNLERLEDEIGVKLEELGVQIPTLIVVRDGEVTRVLKAWYYEDDYGPATFQIVELEDTVLIIDK